jgi:hypothetical protein
MGNVLARLKCPDVKSKKVVGYTAPFKVSSLKPKAAKQNLPEQYQGKRIYLNSAVP